MSAAEKLLSRLRRVRKTGRGTWSASCPTRDDKSPSLSIRECDDGRVLLIDFGGEDTESILAAVGLQFADLYPERQAGGYGPVKRPFNAANVLGFTAFESSVAAIVIGDALNSRDVSNLDYGRLITSHKRLVYAAEVCHVYR